MCSTHPRLLSLPLSSNTDELGISLDMELSSITPGLDRPKIQEGQKSKQVVAAGMDTDDLQSRLDSLKRDDDD